ncbi:MAG: hypothetical protein LLG04_13740 [Parachlamydia sp.]|nr:hypothetical protein [Parachlamydia sp.]
MRCKKKIGALLIDEKTLSMMRKEYPGWPDITLEHLYLYDRMEKDKTTARELVRLSYLRDMITAEDYARFLEMEKEWGDEE